MTIGFIPTLEFNQDYTPPPFTGPFPSNYLEPAHFYATCLYHNTKRYITTQYNSASSRSTGELLMKFLPLVYFGQTAAYELHVFCGHTDYALKFPDLRELRGNMLDLIHSIHAVLTPQQSVDCMKPDKEVYLINGNQCSMAYMDHAVGVESFVTPLLI
ncbi:hypothetical protein OG21DRAFT_1585441 [Imleria badia]|nr:hypothetical protein OG21DRAFT_1585441 [Imleria badia]